MKFGKIFNGNKCLGGMREIIDMRNIEQKLRMAI